MLERVEVDGLPTSWAATLVTAFEEGAVT